MGFLSNLFKAAKEFASAEAGSVSEVDAFLFHGAWMKVASTYCQRIRYDRQWQAIEVDYGDGSPPWRYSPFSLTDAQALAESGSKGHWFWDHVRVRGTVHDHQCTAHKGVT